MTREEKKAIAHRIGQLVGENIQWEQLQIDEFRAQTYQRNTSGTDYLLGVEGTPTFADYFYIGTAFMTLYAANSTQGAEISHTWYNNGTITTQKLMGNLGAVIPVISETIDDFVTQSLYVHNAATSGDGTVIFNGIRVKIK